MPEAILWITSGCPTASSMVIDGLSAACGSWKTIWRSVRSWRSSRAAHLGDASLAAVLRVVGDPARASPAPGRAARGRTWTCRCRTRRPGRAPRRACSDTVTPSTAFTLRAFRPSIRDSAPPWSWKWTARSSMSRTVSDLGPDSRSTSGFVGNGDLLPLERCAFGLGYVVRQAVLEVGGPALGPGAARRARARPGAGSRRSSSRRGSAGGSGTRTAGRPGPAGRPSM